MKTFKAYQDRIAAAREAQQRAFRHEQQTRPPVLIFCNPFIAFGAKPGFLPEDYFHNPESMLRHQLNVTAARMERIRDDFVPYLAPSYGTGVLASGFGAQIFYPENSDPAVAHPLLETPEDIDRLELPDPYRSGLMPQVLETIDLMRAAGELPVGLTDMQGVLDTAAQLCGYDRLFYWMYDAPDHVHRLFDKIASALIEWLKVQKKHIGEPLNSCYCQLLCMPPGSGVCLSEDDAVSISARLYQEFCVEPNSRIFNALGGGMLHFCGNAQHQIPNFQQIENLRGFHIIPLGNLNILKNFQERMGPGYVLAAAEFMGDNPEGYYRQLFQLLHYHSLLLVPYVVQTVGLRDGQYVSVDRDVLETAERVLQAIEAASQLQEVG
jgi:uroporphyrinogen-III decarboxylase